MLERERGLASETSRGDVGLAGDVGVTSMTSDGSMGRGNERGEKTGIKVSGSTIGGITGSITDGTGSRVPSGSAREGGIRAPDAAGGRSCTRWS